MAIREKVIEGKVTYEVAVNLRSKVDPRIRVQLMRTRIPGLRLAQSAEKELIREAAMELARREGTGSPWGEILDQWYLAHKRPESGTRALQANTVLENLTTLQRFTKDWLERTCQEISPGDVRKVLAQMEDDGYSRSRMKAVKSGINVVFKWGIEHGVIRDVHHSPALGVDLGSHIQTKPPQILSLGEIQKLLDEARAIKFEWYPVWAMALNSGMRSGELYALEWKDIDFDNRLITVSKSYNGRLKAIKSTKAGYWRKVPINQDLEKLLIELRATSDGGPNVLPRLNKWKRGEAAKVLREFCEGIGIESVCFHALRACFATHLLNAGVRSPVVKKICGWTDEKVMTRYIRLAGIDVAGATEDLGFMRPETATKRLVNMADFRYAKRRSENE